MPKVAVLTPVYNGVAFLREAMVSVQAQTYPNLTHFVLDNASTDGTSELLKEFQGGRVPVVVQRNEKLLSQQENWNRCVALGVGDADYFRILCADDAIEPTCIERMVTVAEADRDVQLVGCHRRTSDGIDIYPWPAGPSSFSGKDCIRKCFLGDVGFAPPHLLYRSAVLRDRPTLFDNRTVAFDTDAAFAIMARPGARFGFVPEILAFTRKHETSVSTTVATPMRVDYFEWLVFILRYGKLVLAPHEFEQLKKEFKRHYLGRLLIWRFSQGNRAIFDWHLTALRSVNQSPSAIDFIEAIADMCLRKIGMRQPWDRYPQG